MSTPFFEVPSDEFANDAVFVIGGGPSIREFDFSRLRGRGKVIAVNDAGIEPDRAPWADVLFWADRRWFDWNAPRLVNHVGKYKITRKAPMVPHKHDIKLVHFLPDMFSTRADAVGGWCGGSSAVNLAYLFGARVIILLGFDMRAGNWHDNHRVAAPVGQHRDKSIPAFERMEPHLTRRGVTVLNTNPQSALRCFPFADIEELLTMDDLALIERAKYLAVWKTPEYRRISPGMLETDRAWTVFGMRSGQSLIDFGSGPCRATKWFQERGLRVVGVDFAPNAREFPSVPFVEACLWELPEALQPADYGYCCDVMEHIPESRVNDVLGGIAARCQVGCYFRIATRPDRMGPQLIGQPLHVTVRTADYWRRAVEAHFATVDVVSSDVRDVILLARK